MNQRLVFSACAFIALATVAHFMHESSESADVKSQISEVSPNATTSDVIVSGNTPAPSRSTASATQANAKTSTDSSSAPSTEGSALGFLQTNSKKSWDIKRDDFSSQIRTLTGGELETKSIIAREAGDQFVKFYSQGLFGVPAERVMFNREEVTDRTRLIYDQVVDGVPVYGGSLSLFFENGSLTRVQNDLAPLEIDSSSAPTQMAQAFLSYKSTQASAYDVSLQDHASNRTILYPNGRALVYAYEFVTTETDRGALGSGKSFHVLYDAADRFVIQRRPSAIR